MDAIGKILETFFVSIVYHKAKDGVYLEIIGEKVNIEIAEYVAKILEFELETLWKNTQGLVGARAKNSFFMGVAKGYCDKIESLKNSYPKETEQALLVVRSKLLKAKALVYKRLSSVPSATSNCMEASLLGQKAGKNLSINPAIHQSQKGKPKSLIGNLETYLLKSPF